MSRENRMRWICQMRWMNLMYTFRQLRPESLSRSKHTDPLLFDRVVKSPLAAVSMIGEDEVDVTNSVGTAFDHTGIDLLDKLRVV